MRAQGTFLLWCCAVAVVVAVCPAGEKYVDGDCRPCGVGTYSKDDNYCRTCEAGTVAVLLGATACLPCNAGSFAQSPGLCAKCPAGTFSASSGLAQCQPCPPGAISAPGALFCTPCANGTFAINSTSCAQCPPGTMSIGTECRWCPVGTFSRNGISCQPCPAGQYASSSGSSECKSCAMGMSAPRMNLDACSVVSCPAHSSRSRVNEDGCVCDEGYSGVILWDPTSGTFTGSCSQCKLGFWSQNDRQSCSAVKCPPHSSNHPRCQCDAGYEGDIIWSGGWYAGACTFKGCPLNSIRETVSAECKCLPGYKRSNQTQSCVPCAVGEKSNHLEQCVPVSCPPNSSGYPKCKCNPTFAGTIVWNSVELRYEGTCQSCPAGYRSSEDTYACLFVPCPADSNNHPKCDCRDGYSGAIAFVGGSYVGVCSPCKQGFWRSQNNTEKRCIKVPCPAFSSGHPTCSCKAAFHGTIAWSENVGIYLGQCQSCPPGFASRSSGTSVCERVACPKDSSGHPACMCDTGHYGSITWDEEGAFFEGNCTRCESGTYQDEKGKYSCKPCSSGTWSKPGSSSCDTVHCPANSEGWPNCRCKRKFVGRIGWNPVIKGYSGSCKACVPGFQPTPGRDRCERVPCPAGATDHPYCKCPKGYGGKITWDVVTSKYIGTCEPMECPPRSTGWPDCACVNGSAGIISWVPEDQTYTGICARCPRDQYQDLNGQPGCKQCKGPGFAPNAFIGATTCVKIKCPANASMHPECECNAGFWSQQQGWDPTIGYLAACEECSVGYSSTRGAGSCVPVECPLYSSNHPNCTCDEGFHGNVTWDAEKRFYVGTCTQKDCPENSTLQITGLGYKKCQCNPGYQLLNGSCVPCEDGFSWQPDSQKCEKVTCPNNSFNHPTCECWEGYYGQITSRRDSRTGSFEFVGSCKPCPTGTFSDRGQSECFDVVCPTVVGQLTFDGECVCKDGFEGEMVFVRDKYMPRCVRCETGYYSHQGSPCAQATCPEGAIGHPNCHCAANYQGRVLWDSQLQAYTGSCQKCDVGYFSNEDSVCQARLCPEGTTGHPVCKCRENWFGSVTWNATEGDWQHDCKPCHVGSYSLVGAANCTNITCPLGSTGWPNCTCAPGHTGSLLWVPALSEYIGKCEPCPEGYIATSTKTCERCPRGKWPSGGNCTVKECPENSVLKGGECLCAVGFAGTIRWVAGSWRGECERCSTGFHTLVEGQAECNLIACPDSSSGHPHCTCNEGTIPKITPPMWDAKHGHWTGGCRVCDPGTAVLQARGASSNADAVCTPVSCPRRSSGHPDCKCNPGFIGSLVWHAGTASYLGSCEPCPPGTFSQDGVKCQVVPCPDKTEGGPICRCRRGFTGKVEFNATTGNYTESCKPCGQGRTSNLENQCEDVPCPANSIAHPSCECKSGFEGEIRWDHKRVAYNGSCVHSKCGEGADLMNGECGCIQGFYFKGGKCKACPAGTWSSINSTECTPVPCPAHSTGKPDCSCNVGYAGLIRWIPAQGVYEGKCNLCAPGFWPSETRPDVCEAIPCPANSNGHPSCACKPGFGGNLVWSAGGWSGQCSPCGRGMWRTATDAVCTKVDCPTGAERHPACVCGADLSGIISWDGVQGAYHGSCETCPTGFISDGTEACRQVPCPIHSSGHPNCTCDAGFEGGVLTWSRENRDYKGGCIPCPIGYWSKPGGKCELAACPTNSSGGNGECVCDKGFHGQIVWSSRAGMYIGNCLSCGPGFISVDGVCMTKTCPVRSSLHPLCVCEPGSSGKITWNTQTMEYDGVCEDCPVGKVPNAKGSCVAVPCGVEFAEGNPCHCAEGYFGGLSWSSSEGIWRGACNQCPQGYSSSATSRLVVDNQASTISQCEKVECPENAEEHPYCTCKAGYEGLVKWTGTEYIGLCNRARPSPPPHYSKSPAPSRTPSHSVSASISFTASPSPTPSVSSCSDDLLIVPLDPQTLGSNFITYSNTSTGMQGLYANCDGKRTKYCKLDWSITFWPRGVYRPSQWRISKGSIDKAVTFGDSQAHLPSATWTSIDNSPIDFEVECAGRHEPGCCISYGYNLDGTMGSFELQDNMTLDQCIGAARSSQLLSGRMRDHRAGRSCDSVHAELFRTGATVKSLRHMLVQTDKPDASTSEVSGSYHLSLTLVLSSPQGADGFQNDATSMEILKTSISDLVGIEISDVVISEISAMNSSAHIRAAVDVTTRDLASTAYAKSLLVTPAAPFPINRAIQSVEFEYDANTKIKVVDILDDRIYTVPEPITRAPKPGRVLDLDHIPHVFTSSCNVFNGKSVEFCGTHDGCFCEVPESVNGFTICSTCSGNFDLGKLHVYSIGGTEEELEREPLVDRLDKGSFGHFRKSLSAHERAKRTPNVNDPRALMVPPELRQDFDEHTPTQDMDVLMTPLFTPAVITDPADEQFESNGASTTFPVVVNDSIPDTPSPEQTKTSEPATAPDTAATNDATNDVTNDANGAPTTTTDTTSTTSENEVQS